MSTIISKGGQKTVGALASSVTITFSSDDQHAGTPAAYPNNILGFSGVPSWATSFYVSASSNTAVTVVFGTPVGTGGGVLYWESTGF